MSKDNNNNNFKGKSKNPFHHGERQLQDRVGLSKQVSLMGKQAITNFMPMQHQHFFSRLPMVIVGAEDQDQNIWASVLMGQPGFIQIHDIHNFTINNYFLDIDPLAGNLASGSEMGLLGIQFETRRRNRISAKVLEATESAIKLEVKQCLGNCPRYIQKRQGKMITPSVAPEVVSFKHFDKDMIQFVQAVDSLFIASQHLNDESNSNSDLQGVDVSHRGGMPGFVRVEDEKTLLIPDYMGNNFFNTLGNISLNPKIGIQFLDYKSGHRVMLTGKAEVIWAEDQELPFAGVDRMTRFTLKQGYLLKNSFPFEWQFESYSPFSEAYSPDSQV